MHFVAKFAPMRWIVRTATSRQKRASLCVPVLLAVLREVLSRTVKSRAVMTPVSLPNTFLSLDCRSLREDMPAMTCKVERICRPTFEGRSAVSFSRYGSCLPPQSILQEAPVAYLSPFARSSAGIPSNRQLSIPHVASKHFLLGIRRSRSEDRGPWKKKKSRGRRR